MKLRRGNAVASCSSARVLRRLARAISRVVAGGAFFSILLAAAVYGYQGEQVRDGGTISGTVQYAGVPPSPAPLAITKDREVCGTAPAYDESLLVGHDHGVANAVVTITDIARGEPLKPDPAVSFDQKGCEYSPHVAV